MNLKDSYFHGGNETKGIVKDVVLNGTTLTITYADTLGTNNTPSQVQYNLNNVSLSNYLPLAGGTMTGGITLSDDNSAYNNKGLLWASGSRIGEQTNGNFGIYGKSTIYIRPGTATDLTKGLKITRNYFHYNDQAVMEPLVMSTQTATTGTWTGSLVGTGITALYTGLTIRYYLQQSPSGNATLNLDLDTDPASTTGAIPCYYVGTSRLTTHYGKGCIITLTYFAANASSVNTAAHWVANANYNTDVTVRVFRQTTGYNEDLPILTSRTQNIGTAGSNGSATNVYGVIGDTYIPTINPMTGLIKAYGYESRGDVKLIGAANVDTPSLIFQRGSLLANDNDTNYQDWRFYGCQGNLKVQVNQASVDAWQDILQFSPTGITVTGKFIKSGGTNQQVLLANGDVKALSDFKIGTYIPLAGTSTSAPITGTLYSKAGLYIWKDSNSDVDIWKITGNGWDETFGFTLTYLGSGDSNNNDLVLYAHNQSGTHVETYRVHQNGQMIFGLNPKVKISGTEYELWNKQNLTKVSQLTNDSGFTTNKGTVTSISAGNGLITNITSNGAITTSGTISVNLKDTTANTADSSRSSGTTQLYPVELDKSGYLAVRVPWTNTNSNYVTLNTDQTITGKKTFNNSIVMGTNHYIYGIDETRGAMLFFDGTKTVVGSIGDSSTADTLIRSKSGHIKVGNGTNEYYVLDSSVKVTSISSSSNDNTFPTALAVYNAINNQIATNDALVYKTIISGNANNTNGGALTPAANKGWVYKVNQSGYINGVAVEVGDMLICNTDSTAAATTSNYATINANWDYIQANMDPSQYVTLAGIQTISGEKTFDVLNVGQLSVTGLAQFTNIINGSISGNAATANQFLNARNLKVNLATTSAQSFNGSADATSIGVSGILPVANGGTGNSSGTIPYTKLTGSTTTADQAIVSSGTANGWTLKTLGSNAFNSTAYLPLTGGTLSSSGDAIFRVNNSTSDAVHSYMLFKVNDTNKCFVGLLYSKATLGLFGGYRIQIDSSGNFTLNSGGTSPTISTIAHSGNSTQSAVTLSWGTNSNALKIAGTQFNVNLPPKPTYTLDNVSDGTNRKLLNSHLYAGAQNGTANATSATSDPYLLLVENSTYDSGVQLKAGSGITVSANNGVVTITNSRSNTDRYVNSAAFAMDNDNGIKMTLTRAGSDTNTVTATISQIASTTGRGLAPKLELNSNNIIATQASEYVLTYKSGEDTTPGWRKLPANAFLNSYVTQTATDSTNANYELLFSSTADNTTRTEGARKTSRLLYNPSTYSLKNGECTQQYDSTNACLKFIFS